MRDLNVRIKPEWTGKGNNDDPRECLLAKAIRELGYTGVIVQDGKWSALKWRFIPVGGNVPWDARVISRDCSLRKQECNVVTTLEYRWFYTF